MDEAELAAIAAQAQRTVDQYAGLAVGDMPGYCWEAPDDVLRLVAEVRRLRAEVASLKRTRTAGTAPVIGPEAVRYRFAGPAPLLPYPED